LKRESPERTQAGHEVDQLLTFLSQRSQDLSGFGFAGIRSLLFQARQVPQQVTGYLVQKPWKQGFLEHPIRNAV